MAIQAAFRAYRARAISAAAAAAAAAPPARLTPAYQARNQKQKRAASRGHRQRSSTVVLPRRPSAAIERDDGASTIARRLRSKSLDAAEQRLRLAADKLAAAKFADEDAAHEFNVWSSRVVTHPSFIAREKEKLARWHEEHEAQFNVHSPRPLRRHRT